MCTFRFIFARNMKTIFTQALLIVLFLSSWNAGFSLSFQASLVLSSVNQLVDHVNRETQQNWFLQKQLEQFNRELLQCTAEQPSSLLREFDPEYRGFDYELVQAASMGKSREFHQQLWQGLQKYQAYQNKIQVLFQQLNPDIQCSDAWIADQLKLLQQLAYLFDRQMERHRKIQILLEETLEIDLTENTNPYLSPSLELERLVREGDQLLYFIQHGNPQSVEGQLAVLRRAFLRAQRHMTTHVNQLPRHPGSQRDPGTRYQSVLTQAEAMIKQAEAFIDQPAVPALYDAYGTAYYYYNHLLGNKFSRTGEALVDQYHRFLAISDVPLPQQLIAPNWFQVILPPKKTSQEFLSQTQDIVFLIDISGSMRQPHKIELFKQTFVECLQVLYPEDRISLVTYSGSAKICLPPTQVRQKDQILQALHQVEIGGQSSPEVGIQMAYSTLQEHQGKNQRIVLISDGGFQIETPLLDLLEKGKAQQVALNILYMGREESRMRGRLSKLAKVGGGQYAYLSRKAAVDILLKELGRE